MSENDVGTDPQTPVTHFSGPVHFVSKWLGTKGKPNDAKVFVVELYKDFNGAQKLIGMIHRDVVSKDASLSIPEGVCLKSYTLMKQVLPAIIAFGSYEENAPPEKFVKVECSDKGCDTCRKYAGKLIPVNPTIQEEIVATAQVQAKEAVQKQEDRKLIKTIERVEHVKAAIKKANFSKSQKKTLKSVGKILGEAMSEGDKKLIGALTKPKKSKKGKAGKK